MNFLGSGLAFLVRPDNHQSLPTPAHHLLQAGPVSTVIQSVMASGCGDITKSGSFWKSDKGGIYPVFLASKFNARARFVPGSRSVSNTETRITLPPPAWIFPAPAAVSSRTPVCREHLPTALAPSGPLEPTPTRLCQVYVPAGVGTWGERGVPETSWSLPVGTSPPLSLPACGVGLSHLRANPAHPHSQGGRKPVNGGDCTCAGKSPGYPFLECRAVSRNIQNYISMKIPRPLAGFVKPYLFTLIPCLRPYPTPKENWPVCAEMGCRTMTPNTKQTKSFFDPYDVTQTRSLFCMSKDKNKVALLLSKYQTSPSHLIQVTVACVFLFFCFCFVLLCFNNTQS
uniref:uncharacterized protein LOC132663400 n=1 Tax=Panthera onca TaxID=9690 RepID=UPI0029543B38|nr:uncharacterized protein LOC132663400 [Panthera onca]